MNNAFKCSDIDSDVQQRIDTGFNLIIKTSEFFKKPLLQAIQDDFMAKKEVYTFFHDRLNNRSASILESYDASEFRTLSTDMINSLLQTSASIVLNTDVFNSEHDLYFVTKYAVLKQTFIDATKPLRDIVGTDCCVYNCFIKKYKIMLETHLNKVIAIQKDSYKLTIKEKISSTSEYVVNIKNLVSSIEATLDSCIGTPLTAIDCLNTYVSF